MKKHFFTILQVGGILFFIIIVTFTVLFVEGYEINIQNREIVKKGIIYFEGGPNNASIFVDNKKTDVKFPGEIRVLPGRHLLRIEEKGFFPWEKNINVPVDEVVSFSKILLLPNDSINSLLHFKEAKNNWLVESFSEMGVMLSQPKLHILKYYQLDNSKLRYWLSDIPFTFNQITSSFNGKNLIGITTDGKLFSYEATKKIPIFSNDRLPFSEINSAGGRLFAFSNGTIWEINKENLSIKPFVKLPIKIQKILRIMQKDDYTLLFVNTDTSTDAIVVSGSGSIIFENQGVDSAYLEKETIWFTKNGKLISYSLKENKYIKEMPLKEHIIWLSRIEKTFSFFFLTSDRNLLICDEDVENCQNFAKLDTSFIQASDDKKRFFTIIGGQFELFDFSEDSFLPQFLENLISAVF